MKSLMYVIAVCVVSVLSLPVDDGSWNPKRYGNTGKYIPTDEGKYKHIPNPYIHNDNPYIHDNNPYIHDYEPYVPETENFKVVYTPPENDLPYYKEGYYRNNGIKIINQKHHYGEDEYNFDFETENKIRAGENAVLKNPGSIDEGVASTGYYEYIGPDGFMYRVDYTADENGFRPKLKRIETPYSGKWVLEKNN